MSNTGGAVSVSTHSRLKAAGYIAKIMQVKRPCFNTQPPEGGWYERAQDCHRYAQVSTHSRLKAAGHRHISPPCCQYVSTHSRLKAAGRSGRAVWYSARVSTHSRLKAAGRAICCRTIVCVCFNTQPPEGGWLVWGEIVD